MSVAPFTYESLPSRVVFGVGRLAEVGEEVGRLGAGRVLLVHDAMAKPITQKIKLLSTAGTGFFYVTKKNPRTATEKLSFKKYDPIARKHVAFKESKIK